MGAHALDANKIERGFQRLQGRFALSGFMGAKMPLGLAAGLRLDSLDRQRCVVTLPGGWRTQNPFGSMYWAAQGMAAELATGLHPFVLSSAAPVPVRMILAKCEGEFVRMCKGQGRFEFSEGAAVEAAIGETLGSGENVSCATRVVGYDPDGQEVSRWTFTWAFRAKLGQVA
jgi:hypothetical protein